MTVQVTKLRVFMASPGDVQKERELLDDVLDELNRGIADEKGLVLELMRWETHAWPAIGEDAQDVINRQIAPGDVFVGIMWNRFGTPTKHAESGTKEEFDRAYSYWKEYGRPQIMFYFNRAPFSPSSVDELEQKRKVLTFKKELGDKGALYWEYNGADEFEQLVRRHLTQVIRGWEVESKVSSQPESQELLSQQWFENRLEEAVANVGPRYSPELNVELPIAHLFEGLGRTSAFYDRIKVLYGKTKRACAKAQLRRAEEFAQDEFDSLRECTSELWPVLEGIGKSVTAPIDFDSIVKSASKLRESAWECIRALEEEAERRATFSKEKQERAEDQKAYSRPEDFRFERHHLYELISELGDLERLAQSNEARLANIPALLLVGKAGVGKTHLFCDVAKQRANSGLPTVLLLGGQFSNEEPWSQIVRLLGLSCTKEEFLGALEAAAQAQGAKALILIDALNEGDGKNLWYKHLAGILTTLSRYPWIGLAFSVRTSYENTVVPEGPIPHRLVREVHFGFADHEYQATRTFFDYFGIVHPSVPLLVPEFQNPLFLKLFCQGLKNRDLTRVPSGLRGITAIFNIFVESVNRKLSRPEYLNFDHRAQIIQEAVKRLAEMMAERGSMWLPRGEARVAVGAFLPRDGYEESLFRHLISEGLLAEDRFWVGDDEWCDGIHFSYERLAEHFIAKHLLDRHLDLTNPLQSFASEQPLGSFVKDEHSCWLNRGLLEAFSVQLPEYIGKELTEVAPESADYRPVREAFVESLIWRDPKAITDATLRYINEHIIRYKDTHDQFLDALLTVTANPEHPYNADFLHSHLMELELAERDAWWSIFLHYQYGGHGAVDRLVDWAWSPEDKSHIDDEAMRLCGIALAWLLTTSNRYLRDRATKALVSLFTQRIHVLRQIIGDFLDVNDPYVLERLFAVAYGCAMRSTNSAEIGELAQDVYGWTFKNGEPPPHILLRDYARGVIELALHLGIELDIDTDRVRPPYKSEWPSEIPTEEELKKYDEWEEGMSDKAWARMHLYDSVMGFGDFARYVIGTNSGHFDWSSRRLDEPRKPSRKEIYEAFVQSLTDRQGKAWERYDTIRTNLDFYRRLDESSRVEIFKREFTEEELEDAIIGSEQSFRRTLGKKKLKIFEEHVIPYLNDPGLHRDEYHFDLSIAQRWIFRRVLDLGWTAERFGRFDRSVNRYSYYGREANKPERIGKKYQWIAYHEFLARVSDNFEFRGEEWPDRPEKYEGPWQIVYSRDIDPSCLLKGTERERRQSHTRTWFPSSYDAWDVEPDDVAWLKNSEDLPAVEPIIEVTNPGDGSRWLALETFYRWEQPTPPEEERFEIPRRDIWYMLKSYIVRKSDLEELFEWAEEQDFMGRWMPESHGLYYVFLGEFFWAPAFECHNVPYYHHDGWTRGSTNRIPKEVLVSTDQYIQEHRGYDCSIDETISIYLPAKWLADHMNLRWNGVEGHFFDASGNLVAFDPSVKASGPGALLFNRDALLKFLTDNGYGILWTILGEKDIIGGRLSGDDWKGRLELSGVYRIREGKVEGIINTRFRSRH